MCQVIAYKWLMENNNGKLLTITLKRCNGYQRFQLYGLDFDRWSPMAGGCILQVVAHVGSTEIELLGFTVIHSSVIFYTNIY